MSNVSIKYIGPYFQKRLAKESIVTENDLIIRANSLGSHDELQTFLFKVFTNKRKNKCYKSYKIRETNFLAFNNTVKYLRSHKASKGIKLLKYRTLEDAYPKGCKLKKRD